MNGVFNAVKASGVAERDMQTSNLSLNPVYDYPPNQKPRFCAPTTRRTRSPSRFAT